MYGLRGSVLSVRTDLKRNGIRMSAEQFGSGMERLDLYRKLGAGVLKTEKDQSVPGVYRAGLPASLRGGLHLQLKRRSDQHQRKGTEHHRAGLRERTCQSGASGSAHRQEGGGHWLRPVGTYGGSLPQHAGTFRDGLRAFRPSGRPADVRHPEYETGENLH